MESHDEEVSVFIRIFITFAVPRRNMQREWRRSSSRLADTAPKKRRSGGELLATMCQFDRPGNRIPGLQTDSVCLTTELTDRDFHYKQISFLYCSLEIMRDF